MQTENWENIKGVLMEVLSLEEAERRGFLERTAVSPEVRAEVESLLAYEEASEDLMRLSAIEFSKDFFDDEVQNVLIGQQIGAYQIVRELGQGGMGAVYLATRTDGKFEQKVALKLLKREMNTSALRRRFQQERKILASLEHPNIARLLDAGTTSDKIPFIAMEYIEGLPIDEFCNAHRMDLTERLDLFRQVCATVNFAHRNLIVHRDLKPSNILVNEDGNPKLLDFGISKILTAEFEQINAATVTKLGAMTPGYASPEQLRNKSVTTATDIYSLGVILYELLSGHRPFESKENDLKEIYQAVLENDPPPPSAMLTTTSKFFKTNTEADTVLQAEKLLAPPISKNDGATEPHRLRRTVPNAFVLPAYSLRGDLDNIVLKALRKESERRYSSAENLAADIDRHQRGLPITARPNTLSYRAEKFFRRNRLSVIAGLLIVLAIVGGIGATLWQTRIAHAERAKAEIERAKAEKRFGDVRKLANSYLFDVFPEIEDLEGSLKARQMILKTALEYLDSLSQEAEGDLELQNELATAYEKIGDVQGAVGMTNLGDINAGLASYDKGRNLREAIYAVNPDDLKNKENLSKNYQNTAITLQWNVDTAKAEDYFEKAVALRRELVVAQPDSPDYQNRLAVLLTDYAAIPTANVNNEKAARLLDEAGAIILQTLEKNPEHFYTRKAYPRYLRADSTLKSNFGDYAAATRDIDESVVLTNRLISEKPEDYSLQRTAFLNDAGYCEINLAKRDGRKIVESCLKMIDFNVKELAEEPDEAYALYDLATAYFRVAQGYRLSNDPRRAVEYAGKALMPLTKLTKLSPGINEYERSVAVVENEIAGSQIMLGNADEALKNLDDARMRLEKVTANDPTVKSYQTELAKVYRSTAAARNKKNQTAEAAEYADKSIEIVRRLKSSNSLTAADVNLLTQLEDEKTRYSE